MSASFEFRFEDRPISARPGWTLAAALANAGELALRETRTGPPRGVFCGMGVCQDCLVTVDGVPNRRACVEPARAGLAVGRQAWPGEPPPASRGLAPIGLADLPVVEADLLVVGGGAGGLSAAVAARSAGLDVLLLDERPHPGGQYYKQAAPALGAPPLDAQQRAGEALHAEAVRRGVRILPGAEVWAPLDARSVLFVRHGASAIARGRALLLATGAFERGVPFPGWTLPGVMTTGALQTFWRSHRVRPGRRVLVAGNGPLNLQVANEARDAGAEVVAVVEAAPLLDPRRWPALARMAAADPRLAAAGAALLARARAARVPLLFGEVVQGVEAVEEGLRVRVGPRDGPTRRSFEADVVAVSYGFQPANELARALGCAHDYDPALGALRTRRDAAFETGVPGVFAVGDATGLGGAPAAIAEGRIAGAVIAERLAGPEAASEVRQGAETAQRELSRHRRFQAALWTLYAAPRLGLHLADDDTLICRCEEVTKREVLAAFDAAAPDAADDPTPAIGEIKRRTRCGMGRCQGRYCGSLLADLLAERGGRPLDERAGFAPRGPVKPMTISELVRAAPAGADERAP